VEDLVMNREFWRGRRVFLTGHTGFKGGWLALWLSDMGAEVHGYALSPPTDPNLFTVANLYKCLSSNSIADIRDIVALTRTMQAVQPEVVFHLAAQPLVRHSYSAPVDTYAVNVMGTVNLLEAVRQTSSVKAIVNVTSDKCYENNEWIWPYRENESLGGFDPYSSSKACSELVTAAYRHSFLESSGVQLASARAGNVVGGGDWADDRLVPDFFRASDSNQVLAIRSPQATRQWQHVLEPLSGYLNLAERLLEDGHSFAGAWNFGSEDSDARSVQWIVEYLIGLVPGATWQSDTTSQQHEANILKLDSSKAKIYLGWHPQWDIETALSMTQEWYQAWRQGLDMAAISLKQIKIYEGYI
jgi:CDP-glucose 4,6-dehydratase